MEFVITLLVTFFAGMGAGLGTGFAGMSAAAVISPMLITFLGMDPYMAVGIALSSDVLASAVSAYTYKKNGNLDVKNGAVMMAAQHQPDIGMWHHQRVVIPLADGGQSAGVVHIAVYPQNGVPVGIAGENLRRPGRSLLLGAVPQEDPQKIHPVHG